MRCICLRQRDHELIYEQLVGGLEPGSDVGKSVCEK
jgi:hypothetical protein